MSERPPLSYYLALEYPYTVVPDEGSYFIKFPDLPGCITQVEEAGEIGPMAKEIRTLWLETTYDDGMTIPEPATASDYSGKFVVRLPKSLHRNLAIAAEREGVSLNAYVNYLLAERSAVAIGTRQPHLTEGTKVDTIVRTGMSQKESTRSYLTVVHRSKGVA
jgi:predicted RNase H-like HicB family nuclease